MLTNKYLIAFGIPIVLMLCSAISKKIVRGSAWLASDFYLGVELTFSAFGSAMVYFYELQQTLTKKESNSLNVGYKMTATATFLAISFFLLLIILAIHQDWTGRVQNPKGQHFMLGILCNIIGITLFVLFITLVKGIQ
jgi:hypothetical protein